MSSWLSGKHSHALLVVVIFQVRGKVAGGQSRCLSGASCCGPSSSLSSHLSILTPGVDRMFRPPKSTGWNSPILFDGANRGVLLIQLGWMRS